MAKSAKSTDNNTDDNGGKARSFGVNSQTVIDLAKNVGNEKAEMDKHRGEIGQFIKQFEEAGGHKKAFKWAFTLHQMETDKAQDLLRSLKAYCDWLGVTQRIEGQPDLVDATPKVPEVPPTPGPADAANVH